jgi:ADP-ribosylglycohydrolase
MAKHAWINLAPDMLIEWEQCMWEGKDVAHLKELCAEAVKAGDEALAERALALLHSTPQRGDYPYTEPSDLAGIQKAKPERAKRYTYNLTEACLRDKLAGAWIGRIAGCLLGKPVEGYKKEALWKMLRETNNFPLAGYMKNLTDKIIADNGCAPVDDDTNYTVFGLKLLETYGRDFTPQDVLDAWMAWVPYLATCTAERVAYRNAANGLTAPDTAYYKNPFREWIGAQIRADFFGYANIGDPETAAEMAWRDASISHIKNGIYGEMFVAALIAVAAVCNDMTEAVQAALLEVPANSRFRRDIDLVLDWHKSGVTADEAIEKIHQAYDEHTGNGWCYANSNAMIVVMALLYGEGDLSAICVAGTLTAM